jgi:hypothetical protein
MIKQSMTISIGSIRGWALNTLPPTLEDTYPTSKLLLKGAPKSASFICSNDKLQTKATKFGWLFWKMGRINILANESVVPWNHICDEGLKLSSGLENLRFPSLVRWTQYGWSCHWIRDGRTTCGSSMVGLVAVKELGKCFWGERWFSSFQWDYNIDECCDNG